jgi:hypothetical protein
MMGFTASISPDLYINILKMWKQKKAAPDWGGL